MGISLTFSRFLTRIFLSEKHRIMLIAANWKKTTYHAILIHFKTRLALKKQNLFSFYGIWRRF